MAVSISTAWFASPAVLPYNGPIVASDDSLTVFDSVFSFNYVRLADSLLRSLRRNMVAFSGLKRGQAVLDVCCGTGAQVYEYSKNGLEATGLELDPNMLRQTAWYRDRLPDLHPSFVLDGGFPPISDLTACWADPVRSAGAGSR